MSPYGLAGRRAVVTGASTGIGRAIALELAAAGAAVVVHCRRSRARAGEVAATIAGAGGRAEVVVADLAEDAGRDRLVEEALSRLGGVDIWVNNAGADILTGDGSRAPYAEKLERLLAVDVTATVLLSKRAGALMREAGRGVILNMGWDQAACGMEGESGELFSAAKGAVMSFTKSLALALAPDVRANCLAPGWIRTAWGESAPREWQERVLAEVPLRRWGTPEDVARAARYLASDAAAFITGQVVAVNGGAVR